MAEHKRKLSDIVFEVLIRKACWPTMWLRLALRRLATIFGRWTLVPQYPMPHKAPGVMESNTEWYKAIHVFRGAPLKSIRRYIEQLKVLIAMQCRMIQNNLFFSSPRPTLPARRLFEGTSVKWGCTTCTKPLVPDTPRPFLQSSTLDIDAVWCNAILKSNISIKD